MQGSVSVGYSIMLTDENDELELWATTDDTRAMLKAFREVQQAMPGREYAATEDYSDGTRKLIITKEKTAGELNLSRLQSGDANSNPEGQHGAGLFLPSDRSKGAIAEPGNHSNHE